MADEQNVKIVISALDKTKVGLTSITKSLRSVAGIALNLKTALLSAAGVGGFGYLVKQSLNATDALAKTATKIGTTTEALSRLHYTAGLASVETRTMDMAMQRFTRRLAEAANGTGEAKSALRELNIDARALQKIPLDEQMVILADAFGGVGSEADKVRLAFKLFDSEGVSLVNVLKMGSGGLREMFNEAGALGAVMSTSAAKGVERASDALVRLGTLTGGIKDQFVAALAPAIEIATTVLKDWVLEITKSEGGIAGFARTLAYDFLGGVEAAIVGLQELANGFISVYTTSLQVKNKIAGVFGLGLKSSQEYREELDKAKAAQERFMSGSGVGMSDEAIMQTGDRFAATIAELEELMWQAQDLESGMATPELNFADAWIEKLGLLRSALVSTQETVSGTTANIGESVNNVRQSFTDWSNELPTLQESMKDLAKQGMDGFTNAVTSAITGAAKFADAIKSMAKSIVDSLIKMLVQYYITKPLFDAITGGISGGAGGGGATAPTGKAVGGSVQAGQPYMVGERGQELFVPSQSGSIIPNGKLQSGGGVTVNQTINVSTGVSQTVRSEIVNLMPQIAAHAKAAVAEGRLRGGTYSKQLVGG